MNARSFTPLKYGNNHTHKKNIRLHMKYKSNWEDIHTVGQKADLN